MLKLNLTNNQLWCETGREFRPDFDCLWCKWQYCTCPRTYNVHVSRAVFTTHVSTSGKQQQDFVTGFQQTKVILSHHATLCTTGQEPLSESKEYLFSKRRPCLCRRFYLVPRIECPRHWSIDFHFLHPNVLVWNNVFSFKTMKKSLLT